jgi:hypothetical protein
MTVGMLSGVDRHFPRQMVAPASATDRRRNPDLAEIDCEIAGLVDRSTQELRRAWWNPRSRGPTPAYPMLMPP